MTKLKEKNKDKENRILQEIRRVLRSNCKTFKHVLDKSQLRPHFIKELHNNKNTCHRYKRAHITSCIFNECALKTR